MSKRGPYHKYFRDQDEHSAKKNPRQTRWNRKNVCINKIIGFLYKPKKCYC